MVHLVLSFDYEVFGNGSGDVRRDMIEPTSRLLEICAKYGAKLSVMFEVGEYWAMKKAEDAGLLRLDYSPSEEIGEQIRVAVKCGHDVQLHLHPWWVGAEFEGNRWRLNPDYRRITDLPNGVDSENGLLSVVGVLSRCKQTLEAMIRPVCTDYECLVYRAAMFWGQPSSELIAGLKRVGLIADSSVVSGLYEVSPVPTDYRGVPSPAGYWWTGPDDIGQAGPRGQQIIEFPVYSIMRPYIYNFKWTKLRATLKRRRAERKNVHGHGMMEARQSSESRGTVLRKLCSMQPLKYDFCKLSANDMIQGLRLLMGRDRMVEDDIGTPVVMLGHSKDFWNDRNLAIFLSFINDDCGGRVCFSTFGELSKRILKRDRS